MLLQRLSCPVRLGIGDHCRFTFQHLLTPLHIDRGNTSPCQYMQNGGDAVTGVMQCFLYAFTSRQTQCAEMPSPSPVKPSFSSVVAFTLTCSTETPQAAAIFSPHGNDIRCKLWFLAEDRGIQIAHGIALCLHLFHHQFQQL